MELILKKKRNEIKCWADNGNICIEAPDFAIDRAYRLIVTDVTGRIVGMEECQAEGYRMISETVLTVSGVYFVQILDENLGSTVLQSRCVVN